MLAAISCPMNIVAVGCVVVSNSLLVRVRALVCSSAAVVLGLVAFQLSLDMIEDLLNVRDSSFLLIIETNKHQRWWVFQTTQRDVQHKQQRATTRNNAIGLALVIRRLSLQ
jgi:hypothetical protein